MILIDQEEYLDLVTEWRMTRGIEEQTKAFCDGFNEVMALIFKNYSGNTIDNMLANKYIHELKLEHQSGSSTNKHGITMTAS